MAVPTTHYNEEKEEQRRRMKAVSQYIYLDSQCELSYVIFMLITYTD